MGKVVNSDDLRQWIDDNEYLATAPPPPPPPDEFSLFWPAQEPRVVTQWYALHPQWYAPLPGHEGLDMRALTGVEISAAASGKVIRVEKNAGSGPYGIHVRIEHGRPEATFKTIYAHLKDSPVSVGQQVLVGQVIGRADNTGNSDGPHLHMTLKRVGQGSPWMNHGDIVNPIPYMISLFPKTTIPGYTGEWVTDVGGNFRTSPRLGDNLIRWIPAGNMVEVFDVDRDAGGDWWNIAFEEIRGWFWNPGYKIRAVKG